MAFVEVAGTVFRWFGLGFGVTRIAHVYRTILEQLLQFIWVQRKKIVVGEAS